MCLNITHRLSDLLLNLHPFINIFRHSKTGDQINLTQTAAGKFRFVGFRSEKIDKLLGNQKYEDLIKDGTLVKLGTKKFLRNMPQKKPIIRKPPPKPSPAPNSDPNTAQSNTSEGSPKPNSNSTESEQNPEQKQESEPEAKKSKLEEIVQKCANAKEIEPSVKCNEQTFIASTVEPITEPTPGPTLEPTPGPDSSHPNSTPAPSASNFIAEDDF